MIPFKEDFQPSAQYKPYLAIYTIAVAVLLYVFALGWLVFPFVLVGYNALAIGLFLIVLILLVAFILIWVQLYYKSIVYHLNDTEMTWKRGVWFRKTGIVPYNRITNIDISQGPVMRLFKISNLQIQTAGNSGGKAGSEISIIGVEDAEPLRAFIMDFVRGMKPVAAVTGADDTSVTPAPKSETGSSNEMSELVSEVRSIRKLLEEQKR